MSTFKQILLLLIFLASCQNAAEPESSYTCDAVEADYDACEVGRYDAEQIAFALDSESTALQNEVTALYRQVASLTADNTRVYLENALLQEQYDGLSTRYNQVIDVLQTVPTGMIDCSEFPWVCTVAGVE